MCVLVPGDIPLIRAAISATVAHWPLPNTGDSGVWHRLGSLPRHSCGLKSTVGVAPPPNTLKFSSALKSYTGIMYGTFTGKNARTMPCAAYLTNVNHIEHAHTSNVSWMCVC